MLARYLSLSIQEDLRDKMVFIGGPRQVGKTTLAKEFLENGNAYLNWDVNEHREHILNSILPDSSLIVLDEIHKYRSWRQFVKGFFDLHFPDKNLMVTGSARLDFYRHGGDSLQGRYYYYRLMPLSFAELELNTESDLLNLMSFGGFPEPYFKQSERFTRRWSRNYRERLIQEDLLGLENISDIGKLEQLMLRLPDLVGSPLSIHSLSEDLQVSHQTATRWVQILERLYSIFQISPFGSPRIRAVQKQQKHYPFDWTLVEEKGARFESFMALHLLKWVYFQQDTEGEDIELRYFRDTERREVDFVITHKGQPIQMIECKWKSKDISKSLKYLSKKFQDCDAYQVSAIGKEHYISKEGITVIPAYEFLKRFV